MYLPHRSAELVFLTPGSKTKNQSSPTQRQWLCGGELCGPCVAAVSHQASLLHCAQLLPSSPCLPACPHSSTLTHAPTLSAFSLSCACTLIHAHTHSHTLTQTYLICTLIFTYVIICARTPYTHISHSHTLNTVHMPVFISSYVHVTLLIDDISHVVLFSHSHTFSLKGELLSHSVVLAMAGPSVASYDVHCSSCPSGCHSWPS
jgi:hypothetical protein